MIKFEVFSRGEDVDVCLLRVEAASTYRQAPTFRKRTMTPSQVKDVGMLLSSRPDGIINRNTNIKLTLSEYKPDSTQTNAMYFTTRGNALDSYKEGTQFESRVGCQIFVSFCRII